MAEMRSELDLTRFAETTRRTLYDRIAEIQFADGKDAHAPDDSGLQVVYFLGRWFATWTDLEEPLWRPVPLRMRIARVALSADQEVELYEV
ncbi:MAG TPA: hypothetical protein VIE43_10280 [Thermoanaerobaculia bacterium]|jgi:hypothetical protein|nr:hypothetical protein [Thermoanaerobaculia bacterium]